MTTFLCLGFGSFRSLGVFLPVARESMLLPYPYARKYGSTFVRIYVGAIRIPYVWRYQARRRGSEDPYRYVQMLNLPLDMRDSLLAPFFEREKNDSCWLLYHSRQEIIYERFTVEKLVPRQVSLLHFSKNLVC